MRVALRVGRHQCRGVAASSGCCCVSFLPAATVRPGWQAVTLAHALTTHLLCRAWLLWRCSLREMQVDAYKYSVMWNGE